MTIELSAAIAANRETWTLTDGSTYSDPIRSACAVFVQSYKMDYDNNATELDVTGDDSDPESDSSWQIEYTQDGWYKTYFVVIPDFDSGETYDQYDAVFDSGTVYRSKAANNTEDTLTNTTWWEVIDEPASLANNKDTSSESGNIDSTIYHRCFAANGKYEYANQLSSQNPREEYDNDESLKEYNIFAKMLDEIDVADSRSEVLDGELIARRVQSRFIDATN